MSVPTGEGCVVEVKHRASAIALEGVVHVAIHAAHVVVMLAALRACHNLHVVRGKKPRNHLERKGNLGFFRTPSLVLPSLVLATSEWHPPRHLIEPILPEAEDLSMGRLPKRLCCRCCCCLLRERLRKGWSQFAVGVTVPRGRRRVCRWRVHCDRRPVRRLHGGLGRGSHQMEWYKRRSRCACVQGTVLKTPCPSC